MKFLERYLWKVGLILILITTAYLVTESFITQEEAFANCEQLRLNKVITAEDGCLEPYLLDGILIGSLMIVGYGLGLVFLLLGLAITLFGFLKNKAK